MNKLSTFILVACMASAGVMTAQVTKTVHVETAGTLSTLLSDEEKTTVTELTVTGNIDKTDIYYIGSLTKGNATDFLPRNRTGVLLNIDFSEARVSGDSIPEGAFEGRWLNKVAVPNSIRVIARRAFYNLAAIPFEFQYPTGLKEIGNGAFEEIGLFNNFDLFDLPEGLEIIGNSAFFRSGDGVQTLTLPSTLTSLGGNVFSGCTLGKVYNHGTIPLYISPTYEAMLGDTKYDAENHVFSDETLAACTLYVPKASIDAYREAAVWKDFSVIKAIEDATALPAVKTTETAYGYVANNALTVKGLTGTAVVTLTGLSGKTLLRKTVSSGASIPLNGLGKGIYVVKIGDKTNKIVIK